MNCLSPSILASDFTRLGEQVQILDEAGAQYVHIDVMDGHFVPNLTVGVPVVKSLRKITDRILDVHLMIENPDNYIDAFAEAGADIITVHAETCEHLDRTISHIKEHNILAGVALNPATPLDVLEYVLPQVDMVLIMSVNPGFGGQQFIPYTIDKLQDLTKMLALKGCSCDVEVDGGITHDNVEAVLRAGANIIVAGSAVFQGDIEENVRGFLERM